MRTSHPQRHPRRKRRTAAALLASAALTAAPLIGLTAAQIASPTPAAALDNGLARTPPMGWNDWNAFGCKVSASLVEQTADKIVSSGMKAAGYQYVNIDDCWMSPDRSATGHLVPDPAKFPDGIKPVADYVHSKGLKLGIYETAGTKTCAGFPASLGHEQTDAQDFADWGVDYLKYDNCNNEGLPAEPRYTAMRDALAATGRPILYSLCSWGQESVWTWGAAIGNSWRTTGDIRPTFSSMLSIFHQNVGLARYAGPGAWNDPDMLEVGNGMSATEDRSEFSLWSEMAAPLLSGTDLRSASAQTLSVYTNKDVIAVDQDPLGKQGTEVASQNGLDVLAKPLADGSVAVALFNENAAPATISTTAAAVGLPHSASYALKDLWSKRTTSSGGRISANVPGHGTVLYRVRGENVPAYPSSTVLDEQFPQLAAAGQSGTAVSTFTNDGLEPVTGVHLGVSTPSGWSASALGSSAFPAVAPGATVSARFRVTAPSTASAPILTTELSGTARYYWRDRQSGTASGPTTERIAFPVQAPWKTFTSTTDPVLYGQSGTRLGVYGDGADTYGSTEQYSAVYQPGLEHDGSTTTVEVTAQADTNEWAKSGIMVRNDVTKPGSAAGYVILVATPGDGYALQWDSDGNGQLDQNINVNQGAGTGVGSTVYPVWLRLTRSGDSYTGAYSTDGTSWTTIGTATAPGAATTQDTALFTTSHEAGLPGEADFDHFTQN